MQHVGRCVINNDVQCLVADVCNSSMLYTQARVTVVCLSMSVRVCVRVCVFVCVCVYQDGQHFTVLQGMYINQCIMCNLSIVV